MKDYSKQHKKAWEFDAYDFWVRTAGTPQERAMKDKENPKKMLKQFNNPKAMTKNKFLRNLMQ